VPNFGGYLEGYAPISEDAWQGWARETDREAIADALLHNAGLLAHPGGRGATFTFPLKNGTAFLRRFKRGGFVRHFIDDAYFMDNRPLREFELLLEMRAEGLPVPEPLGVCWRNRFGWYRGAIVTGALNGQNLYDYLRGAKETPEQALRQTGAVIRLMHGKQIWHADLQVRNIMVTPKGVYLLDFDNARKLNTLDGRGAMRNLLRLKRSFEKAAFPATYFEFVGEGYDGAKPPQWLSGLYAIRGKVSDAMRGRQSEDE